MKLRNLFTIAGLSLYMAAKALSLPGVIGDNMILQQNSNALLWGWANPGTTVKVETKWDGRTYYSKAAKPDGRWELKVATPEASYEPVSIEIEGDGQSVLLKNILIGEVWFASGQSNMEMPLQGLPGTPTDGANDAIATAAKNKGKIRLYSAPRVYFAEPQKNTEGKWEETTPESVAAFSAIGYFFAEKLQQIIDVPVGIINCSYGGTCVEAWIPREIVETYPDIDLSVVGKTGKPELNQYTAMYNGMLYPLAGYTVKGFLWNQGESNVGRHDTYAERLSQMVKHWRGLWKNDSLPIYMVEIPPFHYPDSFNGTSGALLREAQLKSLDLIPNSGIISSTDLQAPGEWWQIHPSVKMPAAHRLAYMAAVRGYGVKAVECESPRYESMEIADSGKTAIIKLSNAPFGLAPYRDIEGFEAAGADKVFHPAKAEQKFWYTPSDMGLVYITCPDVEKIEAVRYRFKNYPETKCAYSTRGLPLIPFRTDSW
ncbi:sialate O-acetylesterase [Muribaculum caecicola]|uniref:Sialate O-acetylesterase n=2 Tax=Muribaculum TaxID=1918540 RepID=A0AC61S892_9BACT|nr:sialate O-acetylesterase [Muribaculum caecicola]THG55126.1 sialate O-acetylesterase [Muribaculum caecicola]